MSDIRLCEGLTGPVVYDDERPMDFPKPSPARMYDYYLGGKDNFQVDRDAAEKALSAVPDGRELARANRRFLACTVDYCARNGIDQFVDLGTGIPTSPNVHEVARSANPASSVAYVDIDPMVVVHDRALLASQGSGIAAVRGDIRYPLNIMQNHSVNEIIDFSRPVAILFVAVLHFLTDDDGPYRSVAAFRDRIASGSYVVISHITSNGTPPRTVNSIRDAYKTATGPAVFRTKAEIGKFFCGFGLIDPGLAEVSRLRRNGDGPDRPSMLKIAGGIGRKA